MKKTTKLDFLTEVKDAFFKTLNGDNQKSNFAKVGIYIEHEIIINENRYLVLRNALNQEKVIHEREINDYKDFFV